MDHTVTQPSTQRLATHTTNPEKVALLNRTDSPDVLGWAADQLAPIVAALDPMPGLGGLVVEPRHRWLDDCHDTIEVTFTLHREVKP